MTRRLVLTMLLLTATAWTAAQVPSVRLSMSERGRIIERATGVARDTSDHKCGFRWMASAAARAEKLPPEIAGAVRAAVAAPAAASDTVIGHFQIFYDSTTSDAPALLDSLGHRIPGTALAYVDSVGRIANDVWAEEVTHLRYDAPPRPSGSYPVYLYELSGAYYGQTVPDGLQLNPGQTPPMYATHIEIDNDFREFATTGMDGLRVTLAHEFHHAIQLGSYGYWDDQVFAYELTSTWMESHVYPSIHDYVQYLADFFGSPSRIGFSAGISLGDQTYGGYERCVWGQFLEQRFGETLMTEVWKQMRSVRFLAAQERAFGLWGTSFALAYPEFSYWNYFTADRADPSKSYRAGAIFPVYRRVATMTTLVGGVSVASAIVDGLSTTMYDFIVHGDTMTVVGSEKDAAGPIALVPVAEHVDVSVGFSLTDIPHRTLANGLSFGMAASDLSRWRSYVISASSRTDVHIANSDAFPNPVRLGLDEALVLPIRGDVGTRVEVSILTSGFRRVVAGSYVIMNAHGTIGVAIPSADLRGKIATGIHYVSAEIAGHDYLWKVLLIP
jgi:hypothetical protein